jgi:hypothetical protein
MFVKRRIRAVGLWFGYGCIALMGLWLLGVGANSLPDAGAVGPFVLWGAFLAGAAYAVLGGLYELRANGAERVRRHRQTLNASAVILVGALVVLIGWAVMPPLVRAGSAGAGAGYMLGFLGIFIPNRSRALAIRGAPGQRRQV